MGHYSFVCNKCLHRILSFHQFRNFHQVGGFGGNVLSVVLV